MSELANTILNHLGGNRFAVMTGAKHFVALKDGLEFSIGRNATKTNRVEIVLNGDDTYTMKFKYCTKGGLNMKTFELKKPTTKILKEYSHIYCDQLQELFTEFTHLYTRLF